MAQQSDLYQRITQQIVEAIKAGAGTYRMPWHSKSGMHSMPCNPIGHYKYHGINTLNLWSRQQAEGFASAEWASYRQWLSVGAQVRKGEKGATTVLFKPIDVTAGDSDGQDADSTPSPGRPFVAKAGTVFNATQVDGYVRPEATASPHHEPHAESEALIAASGATIVFGGNSACYLPVKDEIRLPQPTAFISPDAYYGVAFHELTHWTGHEGRCARDLAGRFGSSAYAMEELIAELGAAFLSAEAGISPEPRVDHAQYISTWLKVLQGDPKAIFTASGKASRAAQFLCSKATLHRNDDSVSAPATV